MAKKKAHHKEHAHKKMHGASAKKEPMAREEHEHHKAPAHKKHATMHKAKKHHKK